MIEIRTPTAKEIESIYFDDEIFDRISDDNTQGFKGVSLPWGKYLMIGGYLNNKIISLVHIHLDGQLHFATLKDYRLHAKEALERSLEKVGFDTWVEIPLLYKSVINFAKKMGYKERGLSSKKHLKNGKEYDKLILERRL